MQIVTLTTDFGIQDYYVAMLKGAILRENPNLHCIDLTHNVKNYNIVQAAYTIRHSYRHFPKGTIHVVAANTFYTSNPVFLLLESEGHYFIGPDNGVFSMIFDQELTQKFTLPYDQISITTYREVIAKAVGQVAQNIDLQEIGEPIEAITERFSLQPIIGDALIRGSVIHIDQFENVVLNITRDLWDRYAYYRRFALFFKRHDPITDLCTTYADVPIGENLCLFNAANHLEIAINMGKAASMLSLDIEDTIQVEFY